MRSPSKFPIIRSIILIPRSTSPTLHSLSKLKYSFQRSFMMAAAPGRQYQEALALLGTLQSNAFVRSAISSTPSSSSSMNNAAIPEMIEWVRRAGYDVNTDFRSMNIIHVAGTKGKGSVCAMVDSILNQYSQSAPTNEEDEKPVNTKTIGKIGMYTSPHLVSVRERIAIDGHPISEDLFTKYFFSLWDRFSASATASGHPNPTSPETKPMYFRYLTIMALHCFIREGVQTAVLECGIGGEYDSTNILPASSTTITAITRLGIDHVGMLGTSLTDIAWHKSGIMKSGVEVFTVPQEETAGRVLAERASEKGAILKTIDVHPDIDNETVKLGLEGEFQKSNASLAAAIASTHLRKLGVLSSTEEKEIRQRGQLPLQFRDGLSQVRWAGRCETRKEGNIEWCIDGAHTVESIEVAGNWFSKKTGQTFSAQKILIFNQQERNAPAILSALHAAITKPGNMNHAFDHVIFCTNTPSLKSDLSDLSVQKTAAAAWSELDSTANINVKETIQDAVEYVREVSKGQESVSVLVTGSLYLVGGFLTFLENAKG